MNCEIENKQPTNQPTNTQKPSKIVPKQAEVTSFPFQLEKEIWPSLTQLTLEPVHGDLLQSKTGITIAP